MDPIVRNFRHVARRCFSVPTIHKTTHIVVLVPLHDIGICGHCLQSRRAGGRHQELGVGIAHVLAICIQSYGGRWSVQRWRCGDVLLERLRPPLRIWPLQSVDFLELVGAASTLGYFLFWGLQPSKPRRGGADISICKVISVSAPAQPLHHPWLRDFLFLWDVR